LVKLLNKYQGLLFALTKMSGGKYEELIHDNYVIFMTCFVSVVLFLLYHN